MQILCGFFCAELIMLNRKVIRISCQKRTMLLGLLYAYIIESSTMKIHIGPASWKPTHKSSFSWEHDFWVCGWHHFRKSYGDFLDEILAPGLAQMDLRINQGPIGSYMLFSWFIIFDLMVRFWMRLILCHVEIHVSCGVPIVPTLLCAAQERNAKDHNRLCACSWICLLACCSLAFFMKDWGMARNRKTLNTSRFLEHWVQNDQPLSQIQRSVCRGRNRNIGRSRNSLRPSEDAPIKKQMAV